MIHADGWAALLVVVAFGGGLAWSIRRGDLRALAPGVAAVTVLTLVSAVLQGSTFYWNPPRIAMAYALSRGYPLYVGPAADGPILNTNYAPFSTLAYLPVTLARTTFSAMLATEVLCAIWLLAPASWLLFELSPASAQARLRTGAAIAFFWMVCATSYALRGSGFFQPIDPVGIGSCTLAAAALVRSLRTGSTRALTLSAMFAVLAVWSKQTTAPIGLALPFFVWASRGSRPALRYVGHLAAWAIGLSVLFVLVFSPAQNMWFNIWTIPSHHPIRADAVPFMYLRALVLETQEWIPMIAICAVGVGIVVRTRGASTWRGTIARHPWLLLVVIALAMIVTSYAGYMKEGGRSNNLSMHTYFLALAASAVLATPALLVSEGAGTLPVDRVRKIVGLVVFALGVVLVAHAIYPGHSDNLRTALLTTGTMLAALALVVGASAERETSKLVERGAHAVLAAGWVAMAFQVMPFTLEVLRPHPNVMRGPVIGAYAFASAHRHEAFFPYDPLTTLLTDGELYHFDYGLFDRRLAGLDVSDARFRAHIPSHIRFVLYPRWVAASDTPRESLRYLTEFSTLVRIRGLEEWDVFVRPADAAAVRSPSFHAF